MHEFIFSFFLLYTTYLVVFVVSYVCTIKFVLLILWQVSNSNGLIKIFIYSFNKKNHVITKRLTLYNKILDVLKTNSMSQQNSISYDWKLSSYEIGTTPERLLLDLSFVYFFVINNPRSLKNGICWKLRIVRESSHFDFIFFFFWFFVPHDLPI